MRSTLSALVAVLLCTSAASRAFAAGSLTLPGGVLYSNVPQGAETVATTGDVPRTGAARTRR